MWPVPWKRWLEFCSGWLPTTDRPQEEAEVVTLTQPLDGPGAAATETSEPEQGGEAPPTDDLTQLKGIGPALQKKLAARQIRTFAELAAADAGRLTESLKASQPVSSGAVERWIAAAQERVGNES